MAEYVPNSSYLVEFLQCTPKKGLPPLIDVYSIATAIEEPFSRVTLFTSTYKPKKRVDTGDLVSDLLVKKLEAQGVKLVFDSSSTKRRYRKNDNYSVWKVPKFTVEGEPQKFREIQTPHPTLKRIQRKLLEKIFQKYPLPKYATGFVSKSSIRDNALVHSGGKSVIISIDISNFFPSITQGTIYNCLATLGYPHEVCWTLSEIVTYYNFLPQGAPTSPAISNIVSHMTFDEPIKNLADSYNFSYTRYADDLTFSLDPPKTMAKEEIEEFIEKVKNTLATFKFRINPRKIKVMYPSGNRQLITGLVVNQGCGSMTQEGPGKQPEGRHPCDIRVKSKLFRRIRSVVHNCIINGINNEYSKEFSHVQDFIKWVDGTLAFMKQMERTSDTKELSPRIKALYKSWDTFIQSYLREKSTYKEKFIS